MGYTGHEHDLELGLINMNARIYDPVGARFLTPDPVMSEPFGVGVNPYAYAGNNPSDRTDPTGMSWDQGEDGYLAVGMFTGIVGLGVVGMVARSGGGSAPRFGDVAAPAGAGLDIYQNYLDNKAYTKPTYQGSRSYSTATNSAQQARSAPGSLGAGADWAPGGLSNALSDRSRYAGTEYAINRALNEGNFDAAAEIARNFWDINPKVRIHIDRGLRAESGALAYAATSYYPDTGAAPITLGLPALTGARSLLSTMLHEGIHVRQGQGTPMNWASPTREAARAVNELEAYSAERAISSSLGLSEGHVRAIDAGVQDARFLIDGTEYASRVEDSNYDLFDSDLITR